MGTRGRPVDQTTNQSMRRGPAALPNRPDMRAGEHPQPEQQSLCSISNLRDR